MTSPDQSDTAQPVTRESLETLTVDDLVEQFNVKRGRKADMVDAIIANDGAPFVDGETVVLAVDGVTSNEYHWAQGEDPILVTGTPVPADQADDIIATAAAGGVTIRKVN